MGIEDAPRDVKALRELSTLERMKLYDELYENADGHDPHPSEFRKWDAQKQADKLLTMLLKSDQQEAGYVTIGVALPIRSSKDAVNQIRWEAFTKNVAEALNKLRSTGCQSISSVQFEGHGIIFTAFRPPVPQPVVDREDDKGGIPVVGVPPSVAGRAIAHSLLTQVKSRLCGASREPWATRLNKAVEETLSQMNVAPAPIIELIVTALEEHATKKTEGAEGDIIPILITELRGRLQRQLS